MRCDEASTAEDVLLLISAQSSKDGRTGGRGTSLGLPVHEGGVCVIERLGDRMRQEDGGGGLGSVGQPLGGNKDIRALSPHLAGEQRAGATESSSHFVGDNEVAMAEAALENRCEELLTDDVST